MRPRRVVVFNRGGQDAPQMRLAEFDLADPGYGNSDRMPLISASSVSVSPLPFSPVPRFVVARPAFIDKAAIISMPTAP
jgi:hypothetical protein